MTLHMSYVKHMDPISINSRKTANDSTESARKARQSNTMAAVGTKQCHLFLLYQQSIVLSVTDYGLGLTTMAKTNLLKLNAVQNEEMRTMLSLNKQGMHMTISKSVYLLRKYASLMRFRCSSLLSSSLLWISAATPQEEEKKGFNN